MRWVCGFDTLSAHLVRKSLSLSLSLALGVLPMATAFGREDERTSYLANNRYQDYQNQYKPEKNYSASSQLDRQIRMQNTALALRFQAPPATSLGRVDVPKPTFQTPTIKFDFLGNNAPKVPNALRGTPEALTAPMKPGLLNTIGNALKAVGHAVAYPFQKIGQGIAGLIQRAFGSGNRTTTLTDSQRATLKAYNNIQPTGDGTFKASGQTVAFGRTWEEGATFKVEGDQLRLIQGTSFERTFGGMERKDGGLMPLKMAEVNGVIQPTGLDFDRLAPNTALTVKSPMTIEGFGELKAGEMTYQGAWKSPEGQTTGGRFNFENTLLDLNKDLAHGMDMTNPVALRQATFALQAGLMRLNSAVVEKGAGKYFVSQDESPVDIGRLEKTAGELDKGSEVSLRAIETTKRDVAHRTEALGASTKELSKVTGQGGAVTINMSDRLTDLQREALAVRGEASRIGQAVKAGDYAGLDTATKDLAHRQEALTKKTEDLAGQAAAIKELQKGFRGMELGAKALFQKAEGPVAAQESENLEASAQIAIAAAKVLVGNGAITPEQGAQLGTQITALRNQVLGAAPAATVKPEETAAPEKPGFFGRMLQRASDLKTGVANRCQEMAAKAAGAATAAKMLVADAANETAVWTMAVTQSAAAKTVSTGNVVKDTAISGVKKAENWTTEVTRNAKEVTKEQVNKVSESARDFKGRLETNTIDSMAEIQSAKGWGPKTRAVLGLVTSNISGDAWDGNRTLKFDPKRPTIFINGVFTTNKYALNEAGQIAEKKGISTVYVVTNNTHFVLGDIFQIVGHEFGARDISAIRARDAMRYSIQQYGCVYVWAHSQGTAIAKAALSMLTLAERSRVIYEGAGPQTYVDGKKLGLKEAANIRYPKDPIPITNDVLKWIGMRPKNQDWIYLERQPRKEDLMGHNFLENYLDGKRPEGRK